MMFLPQELKLREFYGNLQMLRRLISEFKNMNRVSFHFKLMIILEFPHICISGFLSCFLGWLWISYVVNMPSKLSCVTRLPFL